MKVGFMLPASHSIALNATLADAATQLGVDSLWVPDHLLGFWHPDIWKDLPAAQMIPDPDAFLDPFTLTGALGAATKLPIGTCVTDTIRRRGVDLARCALTAHQACEGGFILGVGSGEMESTVPFGYDFSKPVGKLEKALVEIRSLFETGEMPGEGPGRIGIDRSGGVPELWVAAQGGPRSLRLAGTYGDAWLALTYDLDRYRSMLATVREAAAEAGRPPPVPGAFPVSFLGESRERIAEIVEETPLIKLLTLFADDDLWQAHGLEHPGGPDARGYHTIPHTYDPERLRALAPKIPFEMFEGFALMGNAEQVVARLEPFAAAGLEHVVLADMSSVACAPEDAQRAIVEAGKMTKLLQTL